MKFIKKFNELTINDVELVGGKNASLGQMIRELSAQGIRIADGFAVTSDAYWHYVKHNNMLDDMKNIFEKNKNITSDAQQLKKVGSALRELFVSASMPKDLEQEIIQAYHELSKQYGQDATDVAVRSSATAEDLPGASFAGQQETFLNVLGDEQLLESCKKSLASLFTDRAIIYRIEKGFDHFNVALSIGVQKMIRSDLASSGVAFSLDTQTGFKNVVMIESSYGLGETIVKGIVRPDEFTVFKTTLEKGYKPIIDKKLGDKKIKIIYGDNFGENLKEVNVSDELKNTFSLNDDKILELAKATVIIENHYSDINNKWTPMDVEWAQDGRDGLMYILQARPETVHSFEKNKTLLKEYNLNAKQKPKIVLQGLSVGQKIASGVVRVIDSVNEIDQVQEGDILVTHMSDPDWVPAMRKVAGIITEQGGRTCHAAIVSRELGIPSIVGAHDAMKKLSSGQTITMDCSQGRTGFIYEGDVPFEIVEKKVPDIKLPIDVMVNIGDPASAFKISQLPVSGVGLARLEFIISNTIKVHPMAAIQTEKVLDEKIKNEIKKLAAPYDSLKDFFVNRLSYGVGTIAAAFYPRPVIVRLSDFKSNEYRGLLGGDYFEVLEENPTLGLRGASRYYHESYRDAFALECKAIKKARETLGLSNIWVMVPFIRTVKEGELVLQSMASHGLAKGADDLKVIMMAEIPSDVILVDDFSALFDGFSIGSNDLTQLTLGVDRDSAQLQNLFDERDPAFLAALERQNENRWQRARMIADRLSRLNVDQLLERATKVAGGDVPGRPHFAEVLVEDGVVPKVAHAFKRYLGTGKP
ncbi:phosphoenolpyruvate synthase, partial [Candidatus Dependentiae bacterium]|nr:phosphoenolpyruvate synthase [Candidatus Dependentiae bacterium]